MISQPPLSTRDIGVARTNRFIGQLTPADLSGIVPHLKDVILERGQVLHEVGHEIEHVYFPHSGRFRW